MEESDGSGQTSHSPLTGPRDGTEALSCWPSWGQCCCSPLLLSLCLSLILLLLLVGGAALCQWSSAPRPLLLSLDAPLASPAYGEHGAAASRRYYVPSCPSVDAGMWMDCSVTLNFSTPAVDYEQLHYCKLDSVPSTPSTPQPSPARSRHNFAHKQHRYFHLFDPIGPIPYFDSAAARALLQNRRLIFLGDSTTQEMVLELVSFLEGSTDDVEYRSAAWSYVRYCEGEHLSGKWRSIRTEQFPSPALSLFNISIHQMWTGNEDECQNNSPIEAQLKPEFAGRLRLHSHSCANRSAHLELLADTYKQEALRSLHNASEDSTARREELFQTLLSSSAADTGDYEPLLQASRALLDRADYWRAIGAYMQDCDASVWPTSTATGSAAETGMEWAPFLVGRFLHNVSAIPAPRSPSFDYVIYSSSTTHSLLRQPLSWARPTADYAHLYARVVSEAMKTVHAAAREAVIWRDGSPDQIFPAMRYLNSEARAAMDLFPAGSHLLWCVQAVVSYLDKPDNRHCSFKDSGSRHERTVYCHQGIQLLLSLLWQHTNTRYTAAAVDS